MGTTWGTELLENSRPFYFKYLERQFESSPGQTLPTHFNALGGDRELAVSGYFEAILTGRLSMPLSCAGGSLVNLAAARDMCSDRNCIE